MLTEKDLLERLVSDYLSESDKNDLREYFEYRVARREQAYAEEKLARTLAFEKKYPNVKEKIKSILSSNNNRDNAMRGSALTGRLKQFYDKSVSGASLVAFIRNAMSDTVVGFKNKFDDDSYYFYLKKDEV